MFGKINDPALEDIQVGLMLYINKLLAYVDGQDVEAEEAVEDAAPAVVEKFMLSTQSDFLRQHGKGTLTFLTDVEDLFEQGETTAFRVLENGNLLLGELYEFDFNMFVANVRYIVTVPKEVPHV